MSEKERALITRTNEAFGTCLTGERLKDDFQKLGISPGMTLLVHCSLSRIGWICGGAVTVIQTLLDILGPQGTLIMPSHTADNIDPKHRTDPSLPSEWFDTIRQSTPGYQPEVTPTFNMGTVSETFRHWPGVLRSEHPLYSVIALGEKAKLITNDHYDACGERSPLARLYDCGDNGYVLLLGVQHRNNSSIHLAEYRSRVNAKLEKNFVCAAAVINPETNSRQWIEWMDYRYRADDFMDAGRAFESGEGNVIIGKVGLAECRFMKQRSLVDFTLDWMTRNRLQL
jgi:aminoglycoside 3-N-acetyltransferase